MRAVPPGAALGLVETFGLVAAIEAADAMLKSAEVELVRQHRVVPAMVTHFVVGETAAVQAAVDAGVAAAARVGRVVASHVIPSPSPDVWRRLVGLDPDAPARTSDAAPEAAAPTEPAAADDPLESMTVRDLRTLARERQDERLTGRAIARASKDDLVAFLRASDGGR